MEWMNKTLQSLLKLSKERLILIFCAGLLLFLLAVPSDGEREMDAGTPLPGTAQTQSVQTGLIYEQSQSLDTLGYEEQLELRIRNLLRGVEGVGEVEVMVALKPAGERSMFEEETVQEVLGIIISADGGSSSVVKAEISEAMEALFGLPSHKIKVLKRVKEGV